MTHHKTDQPGTTADWNLVRLDTKWGSEFYMPEGLVPSQQREIETTGTYEPATAATLNRFITPGMSVLECGSNCGFHTLTMARAVGPTGKVYAYEANPELLPIIHRNIIANDFTEVVEVFNQGVWSDDTTLPFPVRKQSLGGAGLKIKSTNPIKRWKSNRKVKRYIDLEVHSLDTLCQDRNIEFLRMDVEGAEFEAVTGSLDLLRKGDISIVLEWIPRHANHKLTLSLYQTLQDLGYHIYRISAEGLVRIDSAQDFYSRYPEIWQAGQCDVLCYKQDLGDRIERWWS